MRDFKKHINWDKVRDAIIDSIHEEKNWNSLVDKAVALADQDWDYAVDTAYEVAKAQEWEQRCSEKEFEFAINCAISTIIFLKTGEHIDELTGQQLVDGLKAYRDGLDQVQH